MTVLLDTNVVSKLLRTSPERAAASTRNSSVSFDDSPAPALPRTFAIHRDRQWPHVNHVAAD